MTGTLRRSPLWRPTTVRVAMPWAPSRIATGLARCRVKAGGFRYAMVGLSALAVLAGGVQLRHFQRDPVSPVLDLIPVPEVARGQNRPGGRQLSQRPFGEAEFAGIKDAEEDVMVSGMDGLLELGELFWLGGRA